MNRSLLILILIILAPLHSFCQDYETERPVINNINSSINRKIDTLKLQGINDIVMYFPGAYMGIYNDSMGIFDIRYLLWINNSRLYLQKFVDLERKTFSRPLPQLLEDKKLYDFISLNIDSLFDEEVLPFTYKFTYRDIEYYKAISETLHTTATSFIFYTKKNSFEKIIDHFFFRHDLGPEIVNLNYKWNNASKLKTLIDMLSSVIGRHTPY